MPTFRIVLPLLSLPFLGACMPHSVARMPDASIISINAQGRPEVADCLPLAEPSHMLNAFPFQWRPAVAFGCATQHNLAEMIADPDDLKRGQTYAGQDATTAGSAVQRYRDGKTIRLKNTSSTESLGTSTGGGGQ